MNARGKSFQYCFFFFVKFVLILAENSFAEFIRLLDTLLFRIFGNPLTSMLLWKFRFTSVCINFSLILKKFKRIRSFNSKINLKIARTSYYSRDNLIG